MAKSVSTRATAVTAEVVDNSNLGGGGGITLPKDNSRHKVYNVFSMILVALGLTLGTIGMTLFGGTSSKAATVAGNDGIFKYNKINDTYIEITGLVAGTSYAGQDGEGNLIIPAEIEGLPVTRIISAYEASGAFNNCTKIKSIVIPESMTSMGNCAFYNCKELTTINFNATNMSDLAVGNNAFFKAGQVGSGMTVNVGANVTKIPAYLFYPYYSTSIFYTDMARIIEVNFEEGSICSSIGNYAFAYSIHDVTNFKHVIIPDSIRSIGSNAFLGCRGLTSIDLSNARGLETIDNGAFNMSALSSIEFPSGLKSIGSSAFSACGGLISVEFPSGLKSIGSGAFSACSGLTTINFNAINMDDLPNENKVFRNAGSGSEITVNIGPNVTKIPAYLFFPYSTSPLTSLKTVIFEAGSVCSSIGIGAFGNCSGLTIYARETEKPIGWTGNWNSGRPYVFGAKFVTFETNEGTGEARKLVYGTSASGVELPTTLPTGYELGFANTGKYVVGWEDEDNNRIESIDEITGDITLYAVWVEVDKTDLETLVGEVDGLSAIDYTTSTWATFQSKLGEAEALILNEDATQAEVDAMVIALQTAIDGLIDKTNFNDMKAVVQGIIDLNENDYTPNSWGLADLEDALQAADALVGDDATEQDIEDAIEILENALDKLVLKAQTTALADFVAIVEELDEQDYISSTWTEFDAKLSAAQGVLGNPNATQTQVDDALAELKAAKDGLVLKGSKVMLVLLMEEINALNEIMFTTESWTALQTAITNNELVGDDFTQNEIDNAYDAILAAKNGLEKIEVVQDIEDTVNIIDMLDESEFTEESWEELQTVIEEVERVLNDPNSTADEIEKALSDLQSAVSGLKSINGDDNGGNGGKTGDNGNTQLILMVLASIALVGGAVFFTMGRRGKRA